MDTNKTPIVRLLDLSKDLQFIVATDQPEYGKLVDKTLDYLRVLRRELRRLEAEAAKAAKVIGKPAK